MILPIFITVRQKKRSYEQIAYKPQHFWVFLILKLAAVHRLPFSWDAGFIELVAM